MENPDDRGAVLGQGIASYPVVDLAAGNVVVQSSDASILVAPIAAPYTRLTVRSWQESFNIISGYEQYDGGGGELQ